MISWMVFLQRYPFVDLQADCFCMPVLTIFAGPTISRVLVCAVKIVSISLRGMRRFWSWVLFALFLQTQHNLHLMALLLLFLGTHLMQCMKDNEMVSGCALNSSCVINSVKSTWHEVWWMHEHTHKIAHRLQFFDMIWLMSKRMHAKLMYLVCTEGVTVGVWIGVSSDMSSVSSSESSESPYIWKSKSSGFGSEILRPNANPKVWNSVPFRLKVPSLLQVHALTIYI